MFFFLVVWCVCVEYICTCVFFAYVCVCVCVFMSVLFVYMCMCCEYILFHVSIYTYVYMCVFENKHVGPFGGCFPLPRTE